MQKKLSADNISKLNRLEVRGLLGKLDKNASDLARHLGVTPQHVSDMLYGKRNASAYIKRIAQFLNVSPRKITVAKSFALPAADVGESPPRSLAASAS